LPYSGLFLAKLTPQLASKLSEENFEAIKQGVNVSYSFELIPQPAK